MTSEDKKRFSALIIWLGKRMFTQGGKTEITPDLLRDYFDALQDLRIEKLEWGARHIFSNSRWFPMPADLRQAAMLAPASVLPPPKQNPNQIAEFTQTQAEEAKAWLAKLAAGLVDDFSIQKEAN